MSCPSLSLSCSSKAWSLARQQEERRARSLIFWLLFIPTEAPWKDWPPNTAHSEANQHERKARRREVREWGGGDTVFKKEKSRVRACACAAAAAGVVVVVVDDRWCVVSLKLHRLSRRDCRNLSFPDFRCRWVWSLPPGPRRRRDDLRDFACADRCESRRLECSAFVLLVVWKWLTYWWLCSSGRVFRGFGFSLPLENSSFSAVWRVNELGSL